MSGDENNDDYDDNGDGGVDVDDDSCNGGSDDDKNDDGDNDNHKVGDISADGSGDSRLEMLVVAWWRRW